MGSPRLTLLTPVQQRRLKVLRIVAVVGAVVVGIGVVFAFSVHWGAGLVALFVGPVIVYALVALFESVVPSD